MPRPINFVSILPMVAFVLSGCGGGDAGGEGAEPALAPEQRATATRQTAAKNADCRAVAPFYFEIGDARAAIVSGANGAGYDATTEMNIASATKRLFGAYFAEVRAGALTAADLQAMRMQTGNISLGPLSCNNSTTV